MPLNKWNKQDHLQDSMSQSLGKYLNVQASKYWWLLILGGKKSCCVFACVFLIYDIKIYSLWKYVEQGCSTQGTIIVYKINSHSTIIQLFVYNFWFAFCLILSFCNKCCCTHFINKGSEFREFKRLTWNPHSWSITGQSFEYESHSTNYLSKVRPSETGYIFFCFS